jgi:hypothetical protein
MSTLSKKEQYQQAMVNHATSKVETMTEYISMLNKSLTDPLMSQEERETIMEDLQESKVALVSAHNELDEALDNLLGLEEFSFSLEV